MVRKNAVRGIGLKRAVSRLSYVEDVVPTFYVYLTTLARHLEDKNAYLKIAYDYI